jgi:peptidoglycan-N-acetylglucosamine deacetylase
LIRHLLAPVLPSAAVALGLPRTTSRDGVVLTFDDGPHPEGTPAALEALARAGAPAIFFVVGEQVVRRPALVATIADAGHIVALHGYRHRLQLRLSVAEARADLIRGAAAIADAIGAEPRFHRPPYGIYSAGGLEAAIDAGLTPMLWSRWGKDWRRFTTPGRIAGRVLGGIGSGDVVLLHDADFYSARQSHFRTVAALELVLKELKTRGVDTVLPV